MGKQLIIKGADFSANALPKVPVNLWRPNVVDGEAVLTDGYFTPLRFYDNRAVENSTYHNRYILLIQIDEPGTYEWRHPTDGKAMGKTDGGLLHAVSWRSMTNPQSAAGYIAGDTSYTKQTNGCCRIEWPEGQTGPLMLLFFFHAVDYNGGHMAEDCWNADQGGYLTRAQLAQCTLCKVDD